MPFSLEILLRKENLQIFNNMFTPLGMNQTHNMRMPQIISLTFLRNKLLILELILWHPLYLSPGMTY